MLRLLAVLASAASAGPTRAIAPATARRPPSLSVPAIGLPAAPAPALPLSEPLFLAPERLPDPVAAVLEAAPPPREESPGALVAALAEGFERGLQPIVARSLEAGPDESREAGGRVEDFLGSPLAPRLAMDPAMDPAVRADLAVLSGALAGADLRLSSFMLGQRGEAREVQREYFSWLRRQLRSGGELPPIEFTPHIPIPGVYHEGGGLTLLRPGLHRGRWSRLVTLGHELFHHFAFGRGRPYEEDGRFLQEHDAFAVSLILWNRFRDLAGRAALPPLWAANLIRLLRQGGREGLEDYVDRIYAKLEAPPPAQLDRLERQLRGRLARVEAMIDEEVYRRGGPRRAPLDALHIRRWALKSALAGLGPSAPDPVHPALLRPETER